MKYFISIIAFLLTFMVAVPQLQAAGTGVHINFASTTVGSVTWVPIVTSSARGVKGFSIFSTAAFPVEIGVSYSSSSAGSEVRQMIVPPMLTSVGTPGATFYPLALGYGSRISVRVVGTTGDALSSGTMDMSLFYN